MRLGINLIDIIPGKIGGMEQYVRNLLWYINREHQEYEIFIFIQPQNVKSFYEFTPFFTLVEIQKQHEIEQVYTSIHEYNLELWFCPLLILSPKYLTIPTIVTIPDIQHKFFPDFFTEDILKWREENYSFTLKNADKIITISNYSKSTITQEYEIDPDKIAVTYLDSDKVFEKPMETYQIKDIKKKYKLPRNFIYYPANLWPHKNHERLFQALQLYIQDDPEMKLVMTGAVLDHKSKIRKYIKHNNLENNVFFLGYINQKDMPGIYCAADYLIFPSLFEGFGIPLIEAMRCDCPIVCSDIECLKEICADSALYMNPHSPQDIYEKMLEMRNAKLKKSLVLKGQKNTHRFSWEKNAKETVALLQSVILDSKNQNITPKQPIISVIFILKNTRIEAIENISRISNIKKSWLEIIVVAVDDCLLMSIEKSVKLIKVQEKTNRVAMLNIGIEQATCEFITFISAETILYEAKLYNCIKAMKRFDDIDVLYTKPELEGRIPQNSEDVPQLFQYADLMKKNFICLDATIFRKKIFTKSIRFNESFLYHADYDLHLQLAQQCHYVYFPEKIVKCQSLIMESSESYLEEIKLAKRYFQKVPFGKIVALSANWNTRNKIKALYLFVLWNLNHPGYIFETGRRFFKRKMSKYSTEAIYMDGWIAKKFRTAVELDGEKSDIIIEGEHIWPLKQNLKLNISINGKKLKRIIKDKGNFRIIIHSKHQYSGICEIAISSNRTFNPCKILNSNDNRELSFRLNNITFQ